MTELAIKLKVFDGNREFLAKSFHEDTILNIPDKLRVINLHKLFGLGAELGKFAEPVIRIFIKFRITPVYSLLRKIWNLYCLKFRIAANIKWRDILWKTFGKKL